MSEDITPERMAEIKAKSQRKLEFLQREYWRLRNGKQRYMRCPYCTSNQRRRNFPGQGCCALFLKGFKVILDRQAEVDLAMKVIQSETLKGIMNGYVN